MKILYPYLKNYWKLGILALFLAAINQGFSLLDPLLFRYIIDNYASKFGQEVNHPEFEIFETFETDANRKCYQMIDTDKLSRKEMIDYLDKETLVRRDEIEQYSSDELKRRYRSVYNARLKGIGNRNPA